MGENFSASFSRHLAQFTIIEFIRTNFIMKKSVIVLILLSFALSPSFSVAEDEDSAPTSTMSRGKGKGKGGGGGGKGKGKGRRSMEEPESPTPTPDSVTPDSPLEERKLAFFQQRILPVLESKCYNCHESGVKTKGGLALDTAAAILAGGDTGPAIIPGNAEGSLLYQSVTYEDPDFEMPPKERLSASVVKDFKTWIDIGAPDTRSGSAEPNKAAFDPSAGFVTTITAIDGDQITFIKPDTTAPQTSMGGGKGKGKGRSRGSSGETMRLPVSDSVLITTATSARRTGDLLVGIELAGGLENERFQDIGRFGLKARIVIEGVDITEINVMVSQDEADAPIAVKPKRPPMKPSTLNR